MKSVLVAIVCMLLAELSFAQRIGVAKLMHPFKSQYDKLDIQQDFEETVIAYNKKVENYEFVFLHDEITDNDLDSYIIAKCAEYKLDGMLISRMKMVVKPTSIKDNGDRELLKTGQSFVEMAFLDKGAGLIARTMYDTYTQSVNISPNPRKTLKQAVRNCLRQIFNKLDWERLQ